MANGHGGQRTPSKPAAVSGPGALSKRTDGGPKIMDAPGGAYGDRRDLHEIQASAPMGSVPPPAGMSGGGGAPLPIGLGEPSQRPDEPVTAGAPLGPGVGPEAIGLGPQAEEAEDLDRLRRYLPALVEMANRPDATQATRQYVRILRAKLS